MLKSRASSIGSKRSKKGEGSSKNRDGQVFTRKVEQLTSNLKVLTTVADQQDEAIDLKAIFISIVKKNAQKNNDKHWFVYGWNLTDEDKREHEDQLLTYRLNGRSYGPPVNHVENLLDRQLEALQTLPNFHWGQYPLLNSKSLSSRTSKVSLQQRLSHQPSSKEEKPKYLPTSIRNRYIYFTVNNMPSERRQLIKFWRNPQQPSSDQPVDVPAEPLEPVPKRARRATRQVVKLSPQMLLKKFGTESVVEGTSTLSLTVYQNFLLKLKEIGSIIIRNQSSSETTVIMNDYDDDGELQPSKFVHVTKTTGDDPIFQCSCSVYKLILSFVNSEDDSDISCIPEGTVCMHCKVLKDLDNLPVESNRTNDRILCVYQDMKISKYSVMPLSGKISYVHISDGYMLCQNSECSIASKKCKRKITNLADDAVVCCHLKAMMLDKETWEDATALELQEDLDDTNNMDAGIQNTKINDDFDTTNSKWQFKGLFQHKPLVENSLELCRFTRIHQNWNDLNPELRRDSEGYLTGVTLKPDKPDTCDCGAGYDGDQLCYDFTTRLFMRHAPVRCKVFKRFCDGGLCSQSYTGEGEGVFIWTRDTACSDEVCYDFVNRVISSKISFTGFTNDLSRIYRSSFPISAPFMSQSTFLALFFAWANSFNIDFREAIDPWCKYDPKILACDGTHIGISNRNLKIVDICKPTAEIKNVYNKRYNRVMLPYKAKSKPEDKERIRMARTYLQKTAKACLSGKSLSLQDEEEQRKCLLDCTAPEIPLNTVVVNFLNRRYSLIQQSAMAELLLMLSSDAPVSSIIPYRFIDEVRNSVRLSPCSISLINICPEIYRLLTVTTQDYLYEIQEFVIYLCDIVENVHASDLEVDSQEPVPSSYNPASGVAYYFTSHGCKLRSLPSYNIDDKPSSDDTCKKYYPKVSRGGWSHLFLWFCPIHGHCYGFHIINGSEGRKDPFASAYSYMPKAPEELYYDFACSLQEYCLNREPAFFRNTRFWHDVFHGFSHKCGKNYRSRRISNLTSNSEICEQFNAYIQCVKYTGTHLSQSHFCFFLQFFISIWQQKKTSSYNKKVALALSGIQ